MKKPLIYLSLLTSLTITSCSFFFHCDSKKDDKDDEDEEEVIDPEDVPYMVSKEWWGENIVRFGMFRNQSFELTQTCTYIDEKEDLGVYQTIHAKIYNNIHYIKHYDIHYGTHESIYYQTSEDRCDAYQYQNHLEKWTLIARNAIHEYREAYEDIWMLSPVSATYDKNEKAYLYNNYQINKQENGVYRFYNEAWTLLEFDVTFQDMDYTTSTVHVVNTITNWGTTVVEVPEVE